MGDTTAKTGEIVSHTYTASGDYTIVARLTLTHPRFAEFTLTHTIKALVSGQDLNRCSTLGETRETLSESGRSESCGVQGEQILRYQTRNT